MVAELKRGDEVVTSGGIIGKIEKVSDDDRIELLIADNVTITIIKSTVQNLLNNSQTKK
jgi:preprotein translocase subunit YajC